MTFSPPNQFDHNQNQLGKDEYCIEIVQIRLFVIITKLLNILDVIELYKIYCSYFFKHFFLGFFNEEDVEPNWDFDQLSGSTSNPNYFTPGITNQYGVDQNQLSKYEQYIEYDLLTYSKS